jgi:predicted glycoside hydrolase/deacetylase ChbG (UPF0249 family)
MNLRINADDLGYTPAINQAIFDLYGQRRISSVSLLANMPHSQAALDDLRAIPELPVGVHLNLSQGRPLLPPNQVPSLVKEAGRFWRSPSFFARSLAGLVSQNEILAEGSAQIERVLDYGMQVTHLDTHAHWHLLPHLQKIVTRLAEQYHISGMRLADPRRTLLPSRFWLGLTARKRHHKPAFCMPDYFFSLHHWMKSDGKPRDLFFSNALKHLIAHPEHSLEMVVHPGTTLDPEFPPETLPPQQRQWEYDFLRSPLFEEWTTWIGAQIIQATLDEKA